MEENLTMRPTETTDAFLNGFDEADGAFSTADEQEATSGGNGGEAAEQSGETESGTEGHCSTEDAAADGETAETQETEVEAPKTWTLTHLQENKTVNEPEMVQLAQKGMDYDRIREKWDEAKPVMDLFHRFANKAGMSVTDYVAMIRASAKQNEGMSEDEAKRMVALEDREAAIAEKEAQSNAEKAAQSAKDEAEAKRRADIEEFARQFPEAAKDPKSIPKEVWDEVSKGVSLSLAYAKHQLSLANAKAAAAEQNAKNASRVTGSMVSAGNDVRVKDAFLDGFGD